MFVDIKNRYTGEIIYSDEVPNAPHYPCALGQVIETAVREGVDLSEADLRAANLAYADLRGAMMNGADVSSCNFTGADLRGADLRNAKLRNAKFKSAVLFETLLDGAEVLHAKGGNIRKYVRNAA